jgi:hypothetical protein
VETDIKMISDDSLKSTNQQTHMLGGNRETEVAILQVGDMKSSWRTTQTAVKNHGN